MRFIDATWFSHLTSYLHENLTCLLYVVEIVPEQTMYFTAYFALVKDIAEAYGSWVALSLVIMSAILTMVSVQQLLAFGYTHFKMSGDASQTSNTNNFSADANFSSFNLFSVFRRRP